MHDYLNFPLRSYLKENYSLVPSGILVYRAMWLAFTHSTTSTLVPFRVAASTAIYYKGFQFIVMSLKGNEKATLTSFRGMVDFNKIVSDALDAFERRCSANQEKEQAIYTRFEVRRCIGREKTAFGGFGQKGSGGEDEIEGRVSNNSSSPESSGGLFSLDLSVDLSFKYDRELYTGVSSEDPFEVLYFPPHIDKYIKQAEQWMDMGSWYSERKIPWRRGWMLYGPGGTGKSSLAKAVAKKLKIPIYQYFLATLSDQEFLKNWENMSTPCIALFEDFDTIFNKRESLTEHKSLTFDCILNQISGVSSTNGVFLMVTTNHLENIDPAMGVECGENGISTRPGRIDTVIEVGNITKDNRYKMAHQILKDWPEEIERLVSYNDSVTPVQFQEICLQMAFAKLSNSETPRLERVA
jgi:hypothetical protein